MPGGRLPFVSSRVVRRFTHEIQHPPDDVFPLLCPTREYDWIPTWACDLVFSESGFAELDAVFTTHPAQRRPEIWQCSRYQPPFAIDYAVVAPGAYTLRLAIDLHATPSGTRLTWTRTYTGLSNDGNEVIAGFTEQWHDALGSALATAMEAYLAGAPL
jgi:hypothetical protein